MNPLRWRREHRLALAVAAALGAFIGLIFYAFLALPDGPCYGEWGAAIDVSCYRYFYPIYGLAMLKWALVGAIIGAGVVYVGQLLRMPLP